MISLLLDNGLDPTAKIILFLSIGIALVIAITVHEFAHAIAADRLGDPTPRLQGRISLNPLRHLDPIGTLFIVIAGFGWGKPVQFDPFNLRNPHREAAIISIVGPLSNVALALVGSLLLHLGAGNISDIVFLFLMYFIRLNIALALFNMIPVAPLDGFKIVGGLLPEDKAHEWYGLERYGFIFLLLLILPLGNASVIDTFLNPAISFVSSLLIPAGTFQ